MQLRDIITYIGLFFLLGFLLWLTYRRANRKNLIWRLLATVGCVLSLLCLAIPINYTTKIHATEGILLTSNYHPDSLKTKWSQVKPKPQVITYGLDVAKYPTVFSLAELVHSYPTVKQWHIFGNGLPSSELKINPRINFISHLNKIPAGVISIDWPRQITLGEKVLVTGKFNLTATDSEWLYLNLAGKPIDSVLVSQVGASRFTLRYLPKQAGNLLLTVSSRHKNKVSIIGEIPLQVKLKRRLKILYLPGSPSFEVKFLKNYLAAENHRVALRIPVSKGVFQYEWINFSSFPLENISASILQKYDLVITDATQLQKLKTLELQFVSRAIKEEGLGLILIPDYLPLTSSPDWLKDFKFIHNPPLKSESNNVLLSLYGLENQKTTILPFAIKNNNTLKIGAKDKRGRIVVGSKQFGWGTITVSLLPQTFTWQLAGKKETYARFWNQALNQTSKDSLAEVLWHTEGAPLPWVNNPVQLYLNDYAVNRFSSFSPIGIIKEPSQHLDSIYLEQEPILPFRFNGRYWPRESGWHQVWKSQESPFSFYAFPDSSFIDLRQAFQIHENEHFFNNQGKPDTISSFNYQEKAVASIYFFLSFLLCAGFLWIEEKW